MSSYETDADTGLEILEGRSGDSIDSFAQKTAIPLAVGNGRSYILKWNDQKVLVTPKSTVESICADHTRQCDESYARYRASPAGIAAAKQAEKRERDCQCRHDALMVSLPGIVNNEPALMTWLSDFSDAADHTGVKGRDFAKVVSLLEGAGYTKSMCCGLPKVQYSNPNIMAQYIAGQAISCMVDMQMGPHPNMTPRFVEDYRRLRK